MPFSRELWGKFCAQKSIWRPAVNPTERLHFKKYLFFWHKHLAPGNRAAKEEWFLFAHFQGSCGEKFVLKNLSDDRMSILRGDFI
jgi:hypothetical protein